MRSLTSLTVLINHRSTHFSKCTLRTHTTTSSVRPPIAASLIADEGTPALADRSRIKVYEYIWHRARGTPGTYPGNALSVITFNCDRSLEQFLRQSLGDSHPEFRDRGLEFTRALTHFPIVHVYGSLGSLDENSDSYLKYGGVDHPESPDRVRDAA